MIPKPPTTVDPQQHLDEILAAYLKAEEAGASISRQALLARYLEHAGELADFFADFDRVEGLAMPLRAVRRPTPRASRAATPPSWLDTDTVDDKPATGSATPSASKIRCPNCHNPIQLGKESAEVLCPGCGSSFRLRDAQFTDTTSAMKRMGKFQLLERLGLGSFGAVWKARDTELDRIVALKIPHTGVLTENEELERFQREARATAQLRHPNIVSVYEVARLNGLPVIVAEFVAGVPLKDLIEVRRLTFRQAAALTTQIADALEYAHSMGVVHRDIKPANLMLLRGGTRPNPAGDTASEVKDELAEVGKPMVLDFGLALRDAVEQTMTVDGHVLGTPAYMSPEQAAGQSHKADRRSDVYSLGVVLYQLLTGELPFRGSRAMLLDQVLHEEPQAPRKLNHKIPRDLETICLKCLRKEPTRRYDRAADLAADLRRFLADEPIVARRVSSAEQLLRWVRRRPARAGLLLASAVAGLGLLGAAIGLIYNWQLQKGYEELEKEKTAWNKKATLAVPREQYDPVMEKGDTYFYLNRIFLAQRAWWNNDLDLSRELLDECPTRKRSWEWHYLDRLAHSKDRSQEARTLHHHTGGVLGVAFGPDPRWLVSGSDDHTVLLNDLSGTELPRTLGKLEEGVLSVAFSPLGTTVAAGSGDANNPSKKGQVTVWDLASGRQLKMIVDGAVWSVAFSPDGKYLASGSGESSSPSNVQIWDAHSGNELLRIPQFGGIRSVAFSPNGERLAGAVSNAQVVKIWDAKTGKEQLNLAHDSDCPCCLVFSPYGKQLYTSGTAKVVRIWDADSGTLSAKKWRGHLGEIRSLAVSPDGRRVVSSSTNQSFRLWDVEVGEEVLFTPVGHTQPVEAVAFSSDGALIASASRDGTVKIWNGRPRDK